MNRNRRFVVVVSILAVLLGAASLATWRSSAALGAPAPVAGVPAPQASPLAAPSVPEQLAGGPGYLMVNPYQFRPVSPNNDWAYMNADLYNIGPYGGDYYAALTLPDNVTISQFLMYFYDNSYGNLGVFLHRCSPMTGVCDVMGGGYTWDAEDQYRVAADWTIDYAEIDQVNYSYMLQAIYYGDGDLLRLSGVRIDYTAGKVSLPLVLQDR